MGPVPRRRWTGVAAEHNTASGCIAAVPNGHWRTAAFIGGLRLASVTARMTLDGTMDRPAFQAWVEQTKRKRGAALPAALFTLLRSRRDDVLEVQGVAEEGPPLEQSKASNRHSRRPCLAFQRQTAKATSMPL